MTLPAGARLELQPGTALPDLPDATIDARFAATGYGFLNRVGAVFGGRSAVFGGALKDAGIPYTASLAGCGFFLLAAGLLLWLLPQPQNA